MLDTVKIKIKRGIIDKHENYSPEYEVRSYSDLSETEKEKNIYLRKFILKRNLVKNSYMPSIEIYEKLDKNKKKVFRDVLIEFSVPKLILENNLEEISEMSFSNVISILRDKLYKIGISVKEGYLEEAIVTKAHFGKNILLPKEYTIKSIFDELKNTGMGKSYDSTEKVMTKNKDEIFHLYGGTKEYVFYDKIRDIKNNKIKSADKLKTSYEKELVKNLNIEHREVLRYEYRLKNYRALQAEINKVLVRHHQETVVFKDLFNEELWKIIINKSWSKIIDKPENQLSLIFETKDKEKVKNIVRSVFEICAGKKSGAHSQNEAFITIGLGYLASEYGMKFIIKEAERVWSKKSAGNRLKNKIKRAIETLDGISYPNNIEFIDLEIKKFKRLTQQNIDTML